MITERNGYEHVQPPPMIVDEEPPAPQIESPHPQAPPPRVEEEEPIIRHVCHLVGCKRKGFVQHMSHETRLDRQDTSGILCYQPASTLCNSKRICTVSEKMPKRGPSAARRLRLRRRMSLRSRRKRSFIKWKPKRPNGRQQVSCSVKQRCTGLMRVIHAQACKTM